MNKLPSTLEECHQVIRLLLSKLDDLCQRLDAVEADNKKLRLENTELKERLNNNSSNSSLPPAKSFKKKKNTREPSGKKAGGQPGHKGHYRELLSIDQVDFVQSCPLPIKCVCGKKIKPTAGTIRHPVYELPVLKLAVTEYQLHKGHYEACGCKPIASLPEGITWGITGPRLTSFMTELTVKYGLSRAEQKTFLKEIFNFLISTGTIFNKQKIVNAAMQAPVEELLPIVKEGKSVNADETGHNRNGKKEWVWGFFSATAGHFSIHACVEKKYYVI
jgi:transposase